MTSYNKSNVEPNPNLNQKMHKAVLMSLHLTYQISMINLLLVDMIIQAPYIIETKKPADLQLLRKGD